MIVVDNNNHIALYNRANTYATLKQYDHALPDATHVISLRPQWAKVRIYSIERKNRHSKK